MTAAYLVQILVLAAVLAVAVWAMRRGWSRRKMAQRVRFGALPPVPAAADRGEALVGPVKGMYIGSAFAPNWQDRVAWGSLGLRARATLVSHMEGFLLDIPSPGRAEGLWIPAAAVVAVRSERAAAGKVARENAFGVIRWTLPNGTLLDTAFRADDPAAQAAWISSNDQSGRVR
ncbi:conserved hypothetical protein [Segniliparus rotundus DSM 44985]|uniref:PH domain-containing protein n=1 Tax=Segniliparus rotundus (strain ATCC BAA-972 / CDC 1076 / CIP 108378 / DSM 44985 / JCM 13578) TaxID=640132 RepID=D6ZAM7_SEGRD|nr:hypothetical protein [Segniliparus rotundus]ADG98763.1 conserved hypothetical protein [Segniliparus rotundus DSM 44985]